MELCSIAFLVTLRPSFIFFALVLFVAPAYPRRHPLEENHVSLESAQPVPRSVTLSSSKVLQPLLPSGRYSSRLDKRFETKACGFTPLPFKAQTWKDLELDTYIKEYPNGHNLTLEEYAASVGASNFVCGIGAGCNAGNCNPNIAENNWYILFAIQQWNAQANVMYTAIGTAIQVVSDSMTDMINKLFPAADASGIIHAKQSLAITAGLTMVSGTVIMDIMMLVGAASGPIGWFLDLLNFAAVAGLAIWTYTMKEPPAPIKNGYEAFTHMRWYLDQIATQAQTALSVAVKKVIHSPISSKDGISGALKDGIYMNIINLPTISYTKAHLSNVTMAMSLNFMFETMNAFITVGANRCTDKGTNGEWPQMDRLSYCSARDQPMKNIIRAKGDKSENTIHNANAIQGIWGISVRTIIRISEACQRTHKAFRYNPYVNGKFPKDPESECIYNLPVCYVTDHSSDIWKSIHKHNQHVAEACKKHSNLPI